MATGYEQVDALQKQTNQLYDKQQAQQNTIIDTSTNQAIAEIERNKQKTDADLIKTNRGLYTDYQKQVNPYGANAESLAQQGLGNSGLAETTKANYYNTYQTARTEATNNANTIKADFDADIVKARQNGDIQKAQAALELFKQKANDLLNFYNLRFDVDQFNYQKSRDRVSDNQWQKQYDYQVSRDKVSDNQWNKTFKYQQSRDKVADSQWLKEYNLSKKKAVSSGGGSSRKSSGSKKKKSGNSGSLSVSNGSKESVQTKESKLVQQKLNEAWQGVVSSFAGKKTSAKKEDQRAKTIAKLKKLS